VHLGVGGLHRAHQALYLDDLAQRGVTTDWGEHGVGLLDGDRRMAEALGPKDSLHTLVERDAEGESAHIVGSLIGYAFAPANPSAVLDMLVDPATRIVTLTITEGGYLVDDTTGLFDVDHPGGTRRRQPRYAVHRVRLSVHRVGQKARHWETAVHGAVGRQPARQWADRPHSNRLVRTTAR
jgi:mannitol 2-dehydrogenase